ncbi:MULTISPECIES: ferrochelatase [Nitrosomonas]|uniref:ferrochelatase n=1 Tax=Nitrosomonas TaxID=914 RepID=UPI001938EFB3|nr:MULTISPECIES: ferrochelatase [Nitrosomonas]QOJ08532.1 MAG: ferrochelatase [Nitrosomonas sp. H1_AOB3]HNS58566.1 ferrochelatase [Nitrosomonas europaea]
MTRMLPEPAYRHGSVGKTGVLMINLGTPDAPTAKALRAYLKQFLSEPRIVEFPRWLWWFILNGIILNVRPAKSAKKYEQIWTSEGSPLRVHTARQTALVAALLEQQADSSLVVEYAMIIGNPSIAEKLQQMKVQGCDRILVLPLFPQYAASSTGCVLDGVFSELRKMRNIPDIRTVRHYHDDPGYIAALAQNVRDYWEKHGQPDKLIISFHGVPRKTLEMGDPYHCECQKTGRLLAEALELADDRYQICFQSRFGFAQWLGPYTAEILAELGKQKTGRVDVVCPGFVSDCLETLEEIALEGKAIFTEAGGGEFHYIPSLNEHPLWIEAIGNIIQTHLTGWADRRLSEEAAERSRKRALALGARE